MDLEDSKISDDYAKNIFWFYLLEFFIFVFYKFIICLDTYVIWDTGFFEYLWLCLKDDGKNVKNIIDALGFISNTKMSRKEYEEKLKELTEEMREVCDKCSEDIQKYEELFDYRDMLKDDRFNELNISSFLYDVKDKIYLVRDLNKQK